MCFLGVVLGPARCSTPRQTATHNGRKDIRSTCLSFAGLGMTRIETASACEHKRVQTSANENVCAQSSHHGCGQSSKRSPPRGAAPFLADTRSLHRTGGADSRSKRSLHQAAPYLAVSRLTHSRMHSKRSNQWHKPPKDTVPCRQPSHEARPEAKRACGGADPCGQSSQEVAAGDQRSKAAPFPVVSLTPRTR